jgi:glucosamine--fructose-6-phosphate aminotransferase (isomerizing)
MTLNIPKSVEGAFERTEHPFHMWDGIQSIPDGLEEILSSEMHPAILKAANALQGKSPIHMIGCGSSYFTGLAAGFVFHEVTEVQTTSADAYEFNNYPPPALDKAALIGISHTGGTPVVVQSIRLAKKAGAVTVGYTDVEKSALGREAENVIASKLGIEPALPKTRSFEAALMRHYLLALEMAKAKGKDVTGLFNFLQKGPALAREILGRHENEVKQLASLYPSVRRIIVVGGGPQWATAYEGSLKLTESALMDSSAWELEEAVHGTWASTRSEDLFIILAMEGLGMEKSERLAKAMKLIDAKVWVITDTDKEFAGVDHVTRLSTHGFPELFMPMIAILPLYQFTYFLALTRGIRPDNMQLSDPRYLEARMMIRESIA